MQYKILCAGNLLTMLLVNRVGRRRIMAVSMVMSGVSVFFFPLVVSRFGMIALLCVFSGMSVCGWVTLDMLAVENYPTGNGDTPSSIVFRMMI